MTTRPPATHDRAVLIGRFQPFLNAHHALLRKALDAAPRVVVVIGSAFQARSPKNPFTWQERTEMIRLALAEADRPRVLFVPMRDHVDEERWFAEVRLAIDAALAAQGAAPATGDSTVLIGHVKDATRDYLRGFEGWTLQTAERIHSASAATVRDAIFGGAREAPDVLVRAVPAGTLAFLRPWMATPLHAALAQEWEVLRQHDAAWSVAPYPVVLVTVDCVVKCGGHVLLIRRGHSPGKGLHALPGGFLEMRETTLQSALRELDEETHLALTPAELLACLARTEVFDRPDRSQRGRTITHGHFFDLGDRQPLPGVRADDDAAAAEWVPIAALPGLEDRLLDDHFQMLDHFLGLLPRPLIDA
ncbi:MULTISPECIES: NUDIX domain-containing protein [unclassified Variovorax]|uniref:NUDIX domain-containing protein n=1 Tax=unclassified Variovorax TaxID=663243 RepID=UPI00076D8E9B|nr:MULTISPECIES: NUDIX domain-containing protein [unclassified Variovorax]KWT72266.1 Nicotinamide-nucleotide adenylyltransferase, NadM family [Variovorax sp. WDL1]PNG53214.1 Bifunctional NMN adenylyltransferase/Nudix hydrolase [Variovorax sp. B2]PNG53786.1 Bifunctional NMN adenylyltransferase/Nudix hydrolase [Variovorax sp. B4]VTV11241.1 Bifunctional NMN adenylyltransferase/Nudix hydrolase [Variovorax sp. WDL1]